MIRDVGMRARTGHTTTWEGGPWLCGRYSVCRRTYRCIPLLELPAQWRMEENREASLPLLLPKVMVMRSFGSMQRGCRSMPWSRGISLGESRVSFCLLRQPFLDGGARELHRGPSVEREAILRFREWSVWEEASNPGISSFQKPKPDMNFFFQLEDSRVERRERGTKRGIQKKSERRGSFGGRGAFLPARKGVIQR